MNHLGGGARHVDEIIAQKNSSSPIDPAKMPEVSAACRDRGQPAGEIRRTRRAKRTEEGA